MPAGADERWSRGHALAMLFAAASGLWLGSPLPAACVGALSLGAYVARGRGRYTPASGFGLANSLTVVRLLAIVLLAWLAREAPGRAAAALALAIFVLDGIDGFIARSRGEASEFGARFDMECDALFVQVSALVLYLHGRVPALILLPGSLRYLYVLALALRPRPVAEAPRSRIGRYAFGFFCTSTVASLWPFEPWQRPLSLVASALIIYTFSRSLLPFLRVR